MNTVNTEFSSVEVWFTDQVSKALEIEDWIDKEPLDRHYKIEIFKGTKIEKKTLKDMAFCHLLESLVINMVKK